MNQPQPLPTVGRVVHYVSYGTPGGEYTSQCRAAIVTEVPDPNRGWQERTGSVKDRADDTVGLCVLNPTGQFFNQAVGHDESKKGGTWHWPERS